MRMLKIVFFEKCRSELFYLKNPCKLCEIWLVIRVSTTSRLVAGCNKAEKKVKYLLVELKIYKYRFVNKCFIINI